MLPGVVRYLFILPVSLPIDYLSISLSIGLTKSFFILSYASQIIKDKLLDSCTIKTANERTDGLSVRIRGQNINVQSRCPCGLEEGS